MSGQDLQNWAKRTKALLCTVHANGRNVDQQTNERHFRSLVELLAKKRIASYFHLIVRIACLM
jgi:hypothetical protein